MTFQLLIPLVIALGSLLVAAIGLFHTVKRDRMVRDLDLIARIRTLEDSAIRMQNFVAERSTVPDRLNKLEQQNARTEELLSLMRSYLPSIMRDVARGARGGRGTSA